MTESVTPPLDLEAAKRLEEAATPGPWKPWVTDGHPSAVYFEDGRAFHVARCSGWNNNQPDAEFIAAARTLVPALIAEVERLRRVADAAHDRHLRALQEAKRLRAYVAVLESEVAGSMSLSALVHDESRAAPGPADARTDPAALPDEAQQ